MATTTTTTTSDYDFASFAKSNFARFSLGHSYESLLNRLAGIQINPMPLLRLRSTVDRLDKPSSYVTSKYKKRRFNNRDGPDDRANERGASPEIDEKLKNATTLYVGNLSFYTTEEQIHELFSKCGEVKRIVMGLDRFQKTPCGFCFVEYYHHSDALDCLKYVGGTKLDERIIRTDLDEGFIDGRQYGRGKSGGQVRDEYRDEFDPGRGGYGRQYKDEYNDDYR